MWMSLKAFAANAALNTFGSKTERRGMARHGCKCEQKLPGAVEKCQRFEYSGDPERPIFSWERYRPEWLPRVEEC